MDSGVGRSEADREKLKLQKRYPEWNLWRLGGLYHGWRPDTSPPWKVRGRDWEHLGKRMDAFVSTYQTTRSFLAAQDAAEDVE